MRDKRRRSYRSLALREIEAEMETVRRKLRVENEDVNMWKDGSGYRQKFSTHATWMLLRSQKERCSWARSIWFSKATPKLSSGDGGADSESGTLGTGHSEGFRFAVSKKK
ncbi:hypothetical protein Bca4012_077566 [Brassica carinata]